MKTYDIADPHHGTHQHAFNYWHYKIRRVVENAFGRLKARFLILEAERFLDPDFMAEVATVCCILCVISVNI